MSDVINRESEAMKVFSNNAGHDANEIDSCCLRMRRLICDVSSDIQSDNGQEALSIIEDLISEIMDLTEHLLDLTIAVKRSAELLEESDMLI